MPGITIAVEATVGTRIRRDDESLETEQTGLQEAGAHGWPVGRGKVADTLSTDGRPLEALVLMPEPAVQGTDVRAWPVGVLHLKARDRAVEEVLCVAEAPCFAGLVDLPDLSRWHAEPEAWAAALARLSPEPAYQVEGLGPVREAADLLTDAHHSYLRFTGCPE